MTDIPVKALSEIEVKSEVSENDKILILDSVSEEARLASKDELKGDKGDKGDPGTPGADGQDGKDGKDGVDGAAATISVGTTSTGAAGTSASVTNSGTSSAAVLDFVIPKGDKGDQGVQGETGETGNGIASVTSSKSGKITTVTITETDGDSSSFEISDGADGEGAGDVLGPSSSTDGNVALFDGATGKLIKDSGKTLTASGVGALPDSTKYGASISVSVDTTDYKITTTLKDQDGNTLGTAQVIDLPLESVVVSGSYDSTNKKVILTLQNGSTIEFSVADLVSGLQSEITSSNKLDSDLVDDTNQTHKFVTSTEKTTLSNTSGTNTGDETTASIKTKLGAATSNADGYLTKEDFATFNGKQDALESGTNIKTVNSASLLGSGDIAVQPTLVSGTNIKTINSTSLLGSGNISVLTAETVVSGVSGTTYTIKVSSSAPGSGTPNTTITFVTA